MAESSVRSGTRHCPRNGSQNVLLFGLSERGVQ